MRTMLTLAAALTATVVPIPVAGAEQPASRAQAAQGTKTIRVETTLTIRKFEVVETEDGEMLVAAGRVIAGRDSCERRRTVAIDDAGNDVVYGKDTTDNRGRWRITFPTPGTEGGYGSFVTGEDWVREKNGNRIVCKAYF